VGDRGRKMASLKPRLGYTVRPCERKKERKKEKEREGRRERRGGREG
jgi:hypothetical protein